MSLARKDSSTVAAAILCPLMDTESVSVLFVCEGHSCRSVMAEALAKKYLDKHVAVRSAGVSPHPRYDSKSAIATLKSKFGIILSKHKQIKVSDLCIDSFTYVVAMDSAIAKSLAAITSREITRWQVDDPWGGDPTEYHRCALQILHNLNELEAHFRGPRQLSKGRRRPHAHD